MAVAGMEQATIIGSSLGGAVALEFATRWPEKVASLLLVGPAGMTGDVAWPLRLMALPGLGELMTRPDRARTAQALRQCVADPAVIDDQDIDRAYAMACLPGAQDAFLRLLRVYTSVRGGDRTELRRLQSGMGKIQAPVLVVWGAEDRILPASAATTALTYLPNAALIICAGKGHLIFVEEPTWFNEKVQQFVRAPERMLAAALQQPIEEFDLATGMYQRDGAATNRGLASGRCITPRTMAIASVGLLALFALQRIWQRSSEGSGLL